MRTATTIRQQGFTLLEALVTIVIVSIGLLGLLGLQTVSVVNTQVSSAQTQASIAADNMADRIRANPIGAKAGDYNGIAPTSSAAPVCNSNPGCQPADMALYDGAQWNAALARQLPVGRGFVECVSSVSSGAGCDSYRITVVWREGSRTVESAKSNCHGHNNTLENCFETLVRP